MTQKRKSPGTLAGAAQGSGLFRSATIPLEFTSSPLALQAEFVSRRYGLLPSRAAIVACLAFGERGQ